MTNTVKGSAWGFYIHWPGFVIKENSRFKTRTCISYSTSADLHKKVISSCSCSLPHSPQLNLHGRLQLESGEGTAGAGLPGAHSPQMGDHKPKTLNLSSPKCLGAWEAPQTRAPQGASSNSELKASKAALTWLLVRNRSIGIQTHILLPRVFHKPSHLFEAHLKSLDWNPISSPRVGWGF